MTTLRPDDDVTTPGSMFQARYRIERTLGEGGFATVYAATDVQAGRPVAVKILKQERGDYDASTRARFEREVRLVANLHNPNTVTLFDSGTTDDGRLFIVFEQVPGEDLSNLLKRTGRVEPEAVRHILIQLLGALDEAHRAGVLHRDLKPENVRVFEYDGDPLFAKLLDFGIARSSDLGSPSVTKTGELIGTPRYMSPEQLTAKPLTAASDIYSLGVMIFELLAGPEALGGYKWGEQLDRLMSGHVFSVPEIERIGPDLLAVVQRMTARDLADRYSSAAAVLHDLRKPPTRIPVAPVEAPASAGDDGQRLRLVAGILGLVIVGLIAVIGLRPSASPPPPTNVLATRPPSTLLKPNAGGATERITTERITTERAASPDLGVTEDAGSNNRPDAAAIPRDSIPSKGCGKDPALAPAALRPVRAYYPLDVDREYPHPLVLLLHSDFQNPHELAKGSGLARLAEDERFILMTPEDPPTFGNAGSWRDPRDGLAKVLRAYTTVTNSLCVDLARVYVVGQGDGGRITLALACEPWVTAVVFHGFGMNQINPTRPWCKTPKPVLWTHAANSQQVPRDGRVNCSGRLKMKPGDVDAMWQERNGCRGPDALVFEHEGGRCRARTCDFPTVTCTENGGRTWPGTPPIGSLDCKAEPAADFPTTERVWSFLQAAPPLGQAP